MPAKSLLALAVLLLASCGQGDRTRCGITALAAPGLLLDEFTRPGRTLEAVPEGMPPLFPVRFAAEAARRGLVGRSDSGWIVGVEGGIPNGFIPGFGVLVADPVSGPRGVVLYQGPPIPGAPVIGQVNVGDSTVPMIGLRTPVSGFQDERCPLFPDSLRQ